jgi:hypothetical protein
MSEVFEFKCFIQLRTMARTAVVLMTVSIFLVLSACGDDNRESDDSKEFPAFVTKDVVQEFNKWKVGNNRNSREFINLVFSETI